MKESLPTSTTISHYRILNKLGAGGMGEVYLAEDTKLDRRVAIKLLAPESTGDEQAKKRLVREAKAAAKLDHPHICSIYVSSLRAAYRAKSNAYLKPVGEAINPLAGTEISQTFLPSD